MGSTEGEMMRSWTWIARYALVLLVALLLGAALAELSVFKQTTLGTPKLTASAAARFLGYSGALIVFWLLGRRAALQLRSAGGGSAHLGHLILPLTTLIVLSAGYDVVLAILRPFLSATAKDVYNWIFVLGITGCAVWLVVALYQHAEGMVELLKALQVRRTSTNCASCGVTLSKDAKYCAACGEAIVRDS
jgi:hypothetical protein